MGLDVILIKINGINSINFDEYGHIIDDNGNIIKDYYNVGYWYKYSFIYNFFLENNNADGDNGDYIYIEDDDINLLISYIKNDLDYITSLYIINGKFNKDIYDNIEKYIDSDVLYLQIYYGLSDAEYDKHHIERLKTVLDDLIKSKEIEGKYYYSYSY